MPEAGTYCGQTTPTPRINAIISRRTRVNHSSHSRRLNVCSMDWKPGPTGFPPPLHILNRKRRTGHIPCPPFSETAPLLVAAEFADEGEQRQVHRDNHAANNEAEEHDHDRLESGQQVLDGSVHFFLVEVRA